MFLEEFCHPNHRGVDDQRIPQIVLLSPAPPSTELEHLLETIMAKEDEAMSDAAARVLAMVAPASNAADAISCQVAVSQPARVAMPTMSFSNPVSCLLP